MSRNQWRVDPAEGAPHHRHQSSLEDVLDFPPLPPLSPDQRDAAQRKFHHIIDHFERLNPDQWLHRRYNWPVLLRLTYEHSRSEESQKHFLRAFFRSISLSLDGEDVDFSRGGVEEILQPLIVGFADYLVDNFFLPMKATSRATPQPTPEFHSSVLMLQGANNEYPGTPNRLSALRGTCLLRDRHRCVISRAFDLTEAFARRQKYGLNYRDDDGNVLTPPFEALEVAHILPHSLMKAGSTTEAENSRNAALSILNMFDVGVSHLISGTDIDRPMNALTLTQQNHHLFGDYRIFFTQIPNQQPHTYRIETFFPDMLPAFPLTRTLYVTEDRTIEPSSPRLLAIHRAIAHILHLSGAGEYIDKLLRDLDSQLVREDGSTELARLVTLGLGGWLDGRVNA